MNHRKQAFAENLAKTLNPVTAWIEAGYKASSIYNARSAACHYVNDPAIQAAASPALREKVPGLLREAANQIESGEIEFKAILDLGQIARKALS